MNEVTVEAASVLASAIAAQLGPTVEVGVVQGDDGIVELRATTKVEVSVKMTESQWISPAPGMWAEILSEVIREAMLRVRVEDHPVWELLKSMVHQWECQPIPYFGREGCQTHQWTGGDWLDCPQRKAKELLDGGRMSDL